MQTQEQIKSLVDKLNNYDHQFHTLNKPKVSDRVYDKLFKELLDLEKSYPQFLQLDSPTLRVGAELMTAAGHRVRHEIPMQSLDKAHDLADIERFVGRTAQSAQPLYQARQFHLQLKYDGLSIALRYKAGLLVEALTRGDGSWGESVLEAVMGIDGVPKTIPYEGFVEVRGEVYMLKSTFVRLNKMMEEAGLTTYSSPRNLAAGTVMANNGHLSAARELHFVAYSTAQQPRRLATLGKWKWYERELAFIKEQGFPLPTYQHECGKPAEIHEWALAIESLRDQIDIPADGVVIKVSSMRQRVTLGASRRAPLWATAYKFADESALTKVTGLELSVSPFGVITPIALVEPVQLDGATLARVNMANFAGIRFGIGDTVRIVRSGGTSPKIIDTIHAMAERITPPTECPECQSPVQEVIPKKVVLYRCSNVLCPAVVRAKLERFVGRAGADIQGMGPSLIAKLVKAGEVKSVGDLYNLSITDLINVGVSHTTATGLVENIRNSREGPLNKLIHGLAIPKVSGKSAEVLADWLQDGRQLVVRYNCVGADDLALNDQQKASIESWVSNPVNFQTLKYIFW